MNGIKKVFAHRGSTSSDSSIDDKSRGDPTSPRSQTSEISSGGQTSVDEHEKHPARKGTGGAGVANTNSTLHAKNPTSDLDSKAGSNTASKTAVGPGRSQQVAANDGSIAHSHGHGSGKDGAPADFSNGKVTQTVEHLGEITKRTNHSHTIEEVERRKELERHQHHVQVHHQPIKHEEHGDEKSRHNVVPVTKIHEKHASTDKDSKLLNTVAAGHGHKNEVVTGGQHHQIVDKGETVNETVHHHIHNVVVPLVSHDVHEHHRVKTVIPTHHVMHEAPIIHESSTLEAITKDDFLKRGGVLGSKMSSVEHANVLHQGKCDRTVDGVAEKMAQEMKLKSSSHATAL